MDARDIINLQEAYLQVYSEPELTEEALIAAEYFYEQGLNEDGVNQLIEELGVDEFVDWIDEIVEEYSLYEAAKRGGTVLKGAALRKSRAAQAERTAEFSKTSTAGRAAKKAYKAASREARMSARQSATEKAKSSQTPTPRSESPSKTRGGIGAAIGGALKWAQEKGAKDLQQTRQGLQTLGKTWQGISDTKAAQAARIGFKKGSRAIEKHGHTVGSAAGKAAGQFVRSLRKEECEEILFHLLDEGYAETLDSAEAILESMSDEWVSEILDEAQQIMSVSRGGKQIYKTPRSELHRPSNEPSSHKQKRMNQLARARRNADRRGEESPARERQFDRFVSGTDTPLNRVRTSNIKKLNAPREFDYHDDPYRTVPTDYRARKRRASGR